jgi:hypothetical protein
MEACAGAHEWARRFQALGHEVRLIAPQHVKAYVRGNKNDYNDARAIAEATRVPDMRFVEIKTVSNRTCRPCTGCARRGWGSAQRCATRCAVCWPRTGSCCRGA